MSTVIADDGSMKGLSRTPRPLSDVSEKLRSLSDDDLLLLAIAYVKETSGDVPDFTGTVAVVFEGLMLERRKQSDTTR